MPPDRARPDRTSGTGTPSSATGLRVASAMAGAVDRGPAPLGGTLHRMTGPLGALAGAYDRRPFDEDWFETDGKRLHYETHGQGDRLVILMHGVLLDSQMNRRLAGDLAEQGNRVILLDLPGHGRSDRPRHAAAHRMDTYADTVAALLDHLGEEQAVVGGVSLGANVALHVAARHPDRVTGLLLEMPVLEWAVPSAAMAFVPLLAAVHSAAGAARLVATTVRRLPRTRIGPLDSVLGMLAADPEETAAVLHGLLVGPIAPTRAARRAMDIPALVIGHRLDAIHPFSDADHLAAQLPRATLVEAKSIVELRLFPDRLTQVIARFVDDVWSATPLRARRAAKA
jgi:pimeloyl-ACP methyl ester carboxylesterase